MMHVYLPGEPQRLVEAAVRLARDERVGLFGWVMGTEMPGYGKIELAVGDAADAIADAEIRALFARVLEEARATT